MESSNDNIFLLVKINKDGKAECLGAATSLRDISYMVTHNAKCILTRMKMKGPYERDGKPIVQSWGIFDEDGGLFHGSYAYSLYEIKAGLAGHVFGPVINESARLQIHPRNLRKLVGQIFLDSNKILETAS